MSKPRSLIGIIFRKEIREMFSDRRTLIGAVVTPVLITPLLILLSGTFLQKQSKTEAETTYKVGLVNSGASATITSFLEQTPNLQVVELSKADANLQVAAHSLKAAIILPDSAENTLESGGTATITILNDPGNDVSNSATGRLESALRTYSDQVRNQRVKTAHLRTSFITPIAFNEVATKNSGTTTMYLLAMFIPYVLALSAFSGGMAPANDQIAGEKERGTLETLLVSPATKREIVTGKFCSVACVCLTSGLLSVLGLAVPLSLHASSILPGVSNLGGIKLGLTGILLIAVAQVPLALLFSGLLVAISAFARNPKEVAVYQSPLLMLILVPALGTMFATTDQPLSSALIPIFNSTLVIKQVLAGVHDPQFIILAILSSAVYAAIGIGIATAIFENEKILLKS